MIGRMLPIVVPVPVFRLLNGQIEDRAIRTYARGLAATWIKGVIVAGPMGFGEFATPAERRHQFELWAEEFGAQRVLGACWEPADVAAAATLCIRPLIMLRSDTQAALLDTLTRLPAEAIAYSNPRYSRALITPQIIETARAQGTALGAIKLSKVTAQEIAAVRTVSPDLQIMHGSARDIAGSLTAGANLVAAPPLAAMPHPWPSASIEYVQAVVDGLQTSIDAKADHAQRVKALTAMARGWVAART